MSWYIVDSFICGKFVECDEEEYNLDIGNNTEWFGTDVEELPPWKEVIQITETRGGSSLRDRGYYAVEKWDEGFPVVKHRGSYNQGSIARVSRSKYKIVKQAESLYGNKPDWM